ncbi:two-component system, OmpR family, sensor kinase [Amycolatopsis xylanica]|uniref:histidine kinase n=1 Tax=Amycolatopsis xylanica TaxID=589385 RepID=A0A1H2SWZ4_9PSEU|nr:HAMP domain-containing sensor histidine kinase [Amycolatopsis xylanica]SDW36216.1 two-component system, OmpR family, sensor kinase [Amycolatopsis xylanica]
MPVNSALVADTRRWWLPAITETGAVLAVVALALWQFDRWDHLTLDHAAYDIFVVLALAAAGTATAVAVVAAASPESPRLSHRRLAVPLGFYGLVMIPAGIVTEPGTGEIARFVAAGCFLVLMADALRLRHRLRWSVLLGGAVLVVGMADALADGVPAAPALAQRVIIGGWWAVATGFVMVGARRHQPQTWRVGIGLSLIAVAHLEGFTGTSTFSSPALEFAGLRLLGLLIVLLVLAKPAIVTLRAAGRSASEAAVREHEIRNVLSGLSGVSHLLCADAETLGRAERAALASAVQAELDRMRELLGDGSAAATGATRLHPLLTRLAALRTAHGERIDLDVPAGLRADMPAHALAQVITNLLANCARHAPGSDVRISAWHEGESVTITVADNGPGPRAGHRSAGMGIGLTVCERLLAEHGGSLRIGGGERGCVVTVAVPATVDIPAPRLRQTA